MPEVARNEGAVDGDCQGLFRDPALPKMGDGVLAGPNRGGEGAQPAPIAARVSSQAWGARANSFLRPPMRQTWWRRRSRP